MLPAPTAEAMILMGLLAAMSQSKPKRCSRLTRGILKNLGSTPPKVRTLREAVPALQTAADGAHGMMSMRCAVCPMRKECPAPI